MSQPWVGTSRLPEAARSHAAQQHFERPRPRLAGSAREAAFQKVAEDVREGDEVERAGGEAEPVGGREDGLDLVEAALLAARAT